MDRIPKGGLIGRTMAFYEKLRDMQIPRHAANAGYFIVLSIFPTLVVLLGFLRYTDLDAGDLLDLLSGFLPEVLLPAAEEMVISTYANTSAAVVSVSALGAVWAASRGIYGLLMGLNAIYEAQEDRGYWYTRLISVLYMFLFLLVLLLTLVLNVFGGTLLRTLPPARHGLGLFLADVVDFRLILMLLLQVGVFTAMYMVLPNRKNSFSESLPGAILASMGWTVFSKLFSFYVENFPSYANVFGSVYAFALGMLWLYICLSIVFYGGAANYLLMQKKVK